MRYGENIRTEMISNKEICQVNSVGKNCIIEFYLGAKEVVINSGYLHEINWQEQVDFSMLSEKKLLEEIAWVILSSGMKESIIRKIFPILSEKFYFWESAELIVNNEKQCKTDAISIFNHKGKINAIIDIAEFVFRNGFLYVKNLKRFILQY